MKSTLTFLRVFLSVFGFGLVWFYRFLLHSLFLSPSNGCRHSSFFLSGGSPLKTRDMMSVRTGTFVKTPPVMVQTKMSRSGIRRNLSVHAEYSDNRGGGGDFVAGFLIGGAIFGTLAYVFAPQIRRSLLNEDEYGFRRAKRPIYYDDGLEKTRQTLNEKIGQLNSAIDNVSSRLRGGNNIPEEPIETDAEEATA